ncbi:hypothetical protein HY469_04510 [Candidatus Roizmanbacteria bacterium]|nr:hypothetical protein [Candidatus Roizmanbacteria bacterium]
MSNERIRTPQTREASGCFGPILKMLIGGAPVIGVCLVSAIGAGLLDRAGFDSSDLFPETEDAQSGDGVLIATPGSGYTATPDLTLSAKSTKEPHQDFCLQGEHLRRKTISIVDENGNVITGTVAGANNYWSLRGTGIQCDEIISYSEIE